MTIIVHLSDTHFGTELPDIARAVEQAVLAIKPNIVLISGDITQRARPEQFSAAKEFLDAMPADITFVIPGNHDIPLFNIPQRLLDPYSHYRAVFGLREGVWCHDNIGIIGYDATSRWRHTRGKLLETDLLRHIQQARSKLKPGALLVACAHQPLVVGLPGDQDNVLVNADRVAQLFSDQGVDLVLSGHVHWPLIATTEQAFPQLKRHFVLSGAGTAISRRTRPGAPNSFNRIDIANNAAQKQIRITLMEYSSADARFDARLEKTFGLTDDSWQMTLATELKGTDPNAIDDYGSRHY